MGHLSVSGNEWDYVILSTVRSLPQHKIDPHPTGQWRGEHIGFVGDEHQINVAITRAKKGLIIIGRRGEYIPVCCWFCYSQGEHVQWRRQAFESVYAWNPSSPPPEAIFLLSVCWAYTKKLIWCMLSIHQKLFNFLFF